MDDQPSELLNLVRAGDVEQQISAINRLERMVEEGVAPLIAIVENDELRGLWWLAADALGRIGNKAAVEPLIRMLKKPISYDTVLARKYAAYALAKLADPRSVDVLIDMLHERFHVEEEEEDGTIRVDDEPEHEIIEATSGALAAIGEWRGTKAVIDRLLEGDHWHDHRLGEWGGQDAFRYLLEAINAEDSKQRSSAVLLLGEFGDSKAVQLLIQLLQTGPDNVRQNAAYGLAEIADSSALLALLKALRDPDYLVRFHVGVGIVKLLFPGFRMTSETPALPDRIRTVLAEAGELDLVDLLESVIRAEQEPSNFYGLVFLRILTPYLISDIAEKKAKAILRTIPAETLEAAQSMMERRHHIPIS